MSLETVQDKWINSFIMISFFTLTVSNVLKIVEGNTKFAVQPSGSKYKMK